MLQYINSIVDPQYSVRTLYVQCTGNKSVSCNQSKLIPTVLTTLIELPTQVKSSFTHIHYNLISIYCSLIIMVAKKRKSKRQTLQQKYRIIKRTKQHNQKLRKGVIVNHLNKKKVKDHIPNAWPFKQDLLKEIQLAKEKMENNKLLLKEKRREEMVSNMLCSMTTSLMCLSVCVFLVYIVLYY
jgi:hypothetical protein